jgi:hypothetical protein
MLWQALIGVLKTFGYYYQFMMPNDLACVLHVCVHFTHYMEVILI